MLNQMRKLPLKYFQKARRVKERNGNRIVTLGELEETSGIFVENEQSQTILNTSQETLPNITTRKATEEGNEPTKRVSTQNLSRFSSIVASRPQRTESSERDISTVDLARNENKSFLSQMSQYDQLRGSVFKIDENKSLLLAPARKDKISHSSIHSRSGSYHNFIAEELGGKSSGHKDSAKLSMLKKVYQSRERD